MESTRVLFEPVVKGAEGQERGRRPSIVDRENSPLEFRFSLEGRYTRKTRHQWEWRTFEQRWR